MNEEEIKNVVRDGYARIAKLESPCCGSVGICAVNQLQESISRKIGYTDEELNAAPEGADLNLGCGNPLALAFLREGDTVLDLGSGGGLDCFLAAKKVEQKGKVIGVDMTPEMIDRARENAKKGGYDNVEFRLGEIENLPVADSSVDVVISNCVINLSPDKRKVFQEAFRVLKPTGRLVVSDIVLLKELPDSVKNHIQSYVGCLSGAMLRGAYIDIIKSAGFRDVRIIRETRFPMEFMASDPTAKAVIENLGVAREKLGEIASLAASVIIHGVKPIETVL